VNLLGTAWAFLRKDFLEETSYRANALLGLGATLFVLLFLRIVTDFIGPLVETRLGSYGGNYFAFVVLGLGIYSFQGAALRQLSRKIREAQLLGTLEALLATRTGMPAIVVCLPLFVYLQTSLRVLGYLAIGSLLFGLSLHWGNWPAGLAVLAGTILAFGSLGLVVAALTTAFKRTEPVVNLIGGLSIFFGGIYYPVDQLPRALQTIAPFFPITPAVEGARKALLVEGAGWGDVARALLPLFVFVAVMLPLGAAFFRWALRRAMRDGTLTQY
jgi:ABC-2 type transport system permease protein